MDTIRITQPAPTTTRELRGLELYREKANEITHEGRGVYTVPGCSATQGRGTYTVNLAVFGGKESCDCLDHRHHPECSCKHLVAVTIHRAKTTSRRRREAAARREARKAVHANLASLAGAGV